MRRLIPITIASCAISASAVFACAESDPQVEPSGQGTDDDEAGSKLDASAAERQAPDAFPPPEQCSDAGWCVVDAPQYGNFTFRFRGFAPLDDRAFFFGSSVAPDEVSRLPEKVLEWDYATKAWTQIDDGRHADSQGSIISVWAANKDEVYYSAQVFGVNGAYVHHGRRPMPPATSWSWTTTMLPCTARFRPVISGSGPENVYAIGCGKIFRHTQVDGGESWVVDIAESFPTNDFGGIGSAGKDVWFVGTKAKCTYILRKTEAGYERVAEGAQVDGECEARDGLLNVDSSFAYNQRLVASAPGELLLLANIGTRVARIRALAGGGYDVAYASPVPTVPAGMESTNLWSPGDGSIWFVTNDANVLVATDVFSDTGPTFRYSTIARNGAPNDKPLTLLRGTSTSNLWAVGEHRAFHKSTP